MKETLSPETKIIIEIPHQGKPLVLEISERDHCGCIAEKDWYNHDLSWLENAGHDLSSFGVYNSWSEALAQAEMDFANHQHQALDVLLAIQREMPEIE